MILFYDDNYNFDNDDDLKIVSNEDDNYSNIDAIQ
jgi:hypothetical protein